MDMEKNSHVSVWKFPLEITDTQEIQMPVGSKILCVQTQDEKPCIWALVPLYKEADVRKFRLVGTGHLLSTDENLNYIGTGQTMSGSFVYHLFEILNPHP